MKKYKKQVVWWTTIKHRANQRPQLSLDGFSQMTKMILGFEKLVSVKLLKWEVECCIMLSLKFHLGQAGCQWIKSKMGT